MTIFARFNRFKKRHDKAWPVHLYREILSLFFIKTRLNYLPLFSRKTTLLGTNDNLIFLVGCYNSGTTILREIIGAHPSTSTLPREGVRFQNVFFNLESNGWKRMIVKNKMNRLVSSVPTNKISSLWSRQLSLLWSNPKAQIYIEKSISNALRLPLIRDAFGDVRIIYIIRNGLSVSEGIQRRAAPIGLAKELYGKDNYSFDTCLNEWDFINKTIKNELSQFSRVHSISYEELCASPKEVILSLCNFLEIPHSSYHIHGNIITTSRRSFQLSNRNEASIHNLGSFDISKYSPILANHGY